MTTEYPSEFPALSAPFQPIQRKPLMQIFHTGRLTKANKSDAAWDLYANHQLFLPPGHRRLVDTGVSIEIPEGYVGLVCSRSGRAYEDGVHVLNAPGVIDSGYRGKIGVILRNSGTNSGITIYEGERIAQLLILELPNIELVNTDSVNENTDRGARGFGSSGV